MRERHDLANEVAATDRALITLMSQPAEQRPSSAHATLHARADGLALKLREIDANLRVRFPEYTALTSTTPASLSDTSSLLGESEALLLFVTTRDNIYLWAVTRNSR